MSKMTFSFSERDGLMYISPLPSCHSSRWWHEVLARAALWLGKLKHKLTGSLRHE